jgi:carbonic anhydrase
MFVSRSAVLSFLLAAPMAVNAATSASFSYEPNADNGPANWGTLAIDGNACDGDSNSPIAVETGPCDRYEDYKMKVGNTLSSCKYCNTV